MAASKKTSAIISTEGRENKQFKYTLMGNFPKPLITVQGAIKKNSEYCNESIVRYSGRWGDIKKKKKRPLVWQLKVVSMAELDGVIFQVRRG